MTVSRNTSSISLHDGDRRDGIRTFEYGTSRHHYIYTGIEQGSGVGLIRSAVYLHKAVKPATDNLRLDGFHPVVGRRDKLLPSETCENRHHKDIVGMVQRATASNTGKPNEMFGTSVPSITSKWMMSAWSLTRRMSFSRCRKSAERMEGASSLILLEIHGDILEEGDELVQ